MRLQRIIILFITIISITTFIEKTETGLQITLLKLVEAQVPDVGPGECKGLQSPYTLRFVSVEQLRYGCDNTCFDPYTDEQIRCSESKIVVDDDGDDDQFSNSAIIGIILAVVVGTSIAAVANYSKKKSINSKKYTPNGYEPEKYSPNEHRFRTERSDFKSAFGGVGSYHWESATPTPQDQIDHHIMKPSDFNLKSIDGTGITNPPPLESTPRNVIYARNRESVSLKWEPPIPHDTSTGNIMVGYDVYYQEKVSTSTDWITHHTSVPQTQTEIIFQNLSSHTQNFGVRTIYKTPNGSIIYSNGIIGTLTGE